MQIEDLPTKVLEETIKKWSYALETGWHSGLWHACSVCDEVSECEDCVLYPERWCTRNAETSRLHPRYHQMNMNAWKKDVMAYCNRIKIALNKKANSKKTGGI